jgi:hypothetical protein
MPKDPRNEDTSGWRARLTAIFRRMSTVRGSRPDRFEIDSISDNYYGTATPELKRLIAMADHSYAALASREPRLIDSLQAERLVRAHQNRLLAAEPDFVHEFSSIAFIKTDAELLDRFCQGVDEEIAWNADWTLYDQAIRSSCGRMFNISASDPKLRERLKPPIWPIQGSPNVFASARIARGTDAHDPLIPWLVLCRMEDALTNGLLWTLCELSTECNPYTPLLELGAMGMAFMGLRENRFWICVTPETATANPTISFESSG